jgi:Putative lumazine-binding
MIDHRSAAAAAVRAVMQRYVEAVYKADVATLRGLFHPAAVMSGYLDDTLLAGSPEPFLVDVGGRPSMESTGAPYEAEILDVHASSLTASLRVEETGFFGSFSFVNYFHLLNVDGEWKIVSKTFQSV